MTPKEQVISAHPKADCIRVERAYVVSAVFTARHGNQHGCWPIGVGETEGIAWENAAKHYTVAPSDISRSVK